MRLSIKTQMIRNKHGIKEFMNAPLSLSKKPRVQTATKAVARIDHIVVTKILPGLSSICFLMILTIASTINIDPKRNTTLKIALTINMLVVFKEVNVANAQMKTARIETVIALIILNSLFFTFLESVMSTILIDMSSSKKTRILVSISSSTKNLNLIIPLSIGGNKHWAAENTTKARVLEELMGGSFRRKDNCRETFGKALG
jgi:hypothetical protein